MPGLRGAAMTEPLIVTRDLAVRHGDVPVLDHVDFEIAPGEIVTVVGPNGSGKSTLVRALIGLVRPSGGTVRHRDGLRIGYVPQKLHIDAALPMTVGRFLSLPRPVARPRARAALQRVGVPDLMDRQMARLSGGQFQRVLLARALLSDPDNSVQGFLAAGHVCTVMGFWEYEPIAERFNIPIVVTGFEPVDLLQGIYLCVKQLEEGRAEVENQYSRSVRRAGNEVAQRTLAKVFASQAQGWRGMGEIPASGLGLAPAYARFDALKRFDGVEVPPDRPGECISGEILRGARRPADCPAFGTRCTPEHPLGATMVSSEGTCAAYYRYRRPAAAAARPATTMEPTP